MRVVMDLVGHYAVMDHVGVVNAGGSFLLPCRVGITVERGICVAGHVPHVGDAG